MMSKETNEIIEKLFWCLLQNYQKDLEELTKHTLSGYSLFTNCSFEATKTTLIVTEGNPVWKSFVKI